MKFAMIFPGQGCQKVGMLSELGIAYPFIKDTFYEASDVLNYNLWKLIQNGPSEKLNMTQYTQPALLTSSVAIFRLWQKYCDLKPSFLAGHSLGEYSALVCSNVLTLTEAIKIIKYRARLMQHAVPFGTGAMKAIIGLDSVVIIKICDKLSVHQIVAPSSFNSQDQTVISGNKDAVEKAVIACKLAGAKHVFDLSISIPSHCILLKPASKKLAQKLKKFTFKAPLIPVVNNVDVRCEYNKDSICRALTHQLYKPIRWKESIDFIVKQNISSIIELGPSNILTKLNKNIIDKPIHISTINNSFTFLSVLKYYKRYYEFCR